MLTKEYMDWYRRLQPGDEVHYFTGYMGGICKMTTVKRIEAGGRIRTADGELFDARGVQCTGAYRAKLYRTTEEVQAAEHRKAERNHMVDLLNKYDFSKLDISSLRSIMGIVYPE